jgi:hypothetical protein
MAKGIEEEVMDLIQSPRDDGTPPKVLFLPAEHAGWINKMLISAGLGCFFGYLGLGLPGGVFFLLTPPFLIYYVLKSYYIDKKPHYASDCKEEFWDRVDTFTPKKKMIKTPLLKDESQFEEENING